MNCRHETPMDSSAPSPRKVVGRRCAECTEESEEVDADDGRCTSEAWLSVRGCDLASARQLLTAIHKVSHVIADLHTRAAHEQSNTKAQSTEVLAAPGERHVLTQPSCTSSHKGSVGRLGRFGRVSCRLVQAVAVSSFPALVQAAPSSYWKRDSGDSRIIVRVLLALRCPAVLELSYRHL